MFCGYTYTHKAGAEAGGDGSVGEMLAMQMWELDLGISELK